MQNLDGLLPTGWARHRARRRGRAGLGRLGAGAHGRGRWCAGLGAGCWAGRRALGERACLGAGAAGSWARGRKAQRACAGVRGRARQGAAVRSRGAAGARPRRPGRSLGVQLGQVGCFGAPNSVFSPVRLGSFLSHLMNNVHCKINFRKNFFFLNLIKIK